MMTEPRPLDNDYSFLNAWVPHQRSLRRSLKFFQSTNQQIAVPAFLRYTHTHTHPFPVTEHTVRLRCEKHRELIKPQGGWQGDRGT